MNKRRIMTLIGAVLNGTVAKNAALHPAVKKGLHVGFNLSPYVSSTYPDIPDQSGHGCGTVACLAGHAALRWADDDGSPDFFHELLDIPPKDALALMNAVGSKRIPAKITAKRAAAVLYYYMQTGVVNWNLKRLELPPRFAR